MKKKKIYLVQLPDDFGELWFNEKKKLISWVHCNDAMFRTEYHSFIIDTLGGELIEFTVQLPKEVYDQLYEEEQDVDSVYRIVKKYIKL